MPETGGVEHAETAHANETNAAVVTRPRPNDQDTLLPPGRRVLATDDPVLLTSWVFPIPRYITHRNGKDFEHSGITLVDPWIPG